MSLEEIERGFTSAGWRLDGSFSEYMVIGYTDDGVSILAVVLAGSVVGGYRLSATTRTQDQNEQTYEPY